VEGKIIDVIIVGAGPAGLQAAIHAARKRVSVQVLGRIEKSSLYGAHIENYLGVEGVRDGRELLEIGIAQAKRFGAEILAEDVLSVVAAGELFEVTVESGRRIPARSIIFATGTARKKLKVKGERELLGKGVSYCVDCDANFFRNLKVAVVGNQSAAVDGAITLLKYTPEVYLIAKELEVSPDLRHRLEASQVKLMSGLWVKEILGTSEVTALLLDDESTLAVNGVFVELGAKGAMELALNIGVELDPETFSHIRTGKRQETNIPGIFAAGDIAGQPYQMAKAVGEGCVAGLEAAHYAKKLRKKA